MGEKPRLGITSWCRTTGFKLAAVVAQLQKQINKLIFTRLPCANVTTKVVLPVGAKVTLVVECRDAFLLWGYTH